MFDFLFAQMKVRRKTLKSNSKQPATVLSILENNTFNGLFDLMMKMSSCYTSKLNPKD